MIAIRVGGGRYDKQSGPSAIGISNPDSEITWNFSFSILQASKALQSHTD